MHLINSAGPFSIYDCVLSQQAAVICNVFSHRPRICSVIHWKQVMYVVRFNPPKPDIHRLLAMICEINLYMYDHVWDLNLQQIAEEFGQPIVWNAGMFSVMAYTNWGLLFKHMISFQWNSLGVEYHIHYGSWWIQYEFWTTATEYICICGFTFCWIWIFWTRL